MTAIFISHSNAEPDRAEAAAMRDALAEVGYENVFLDLTGLRAMQEWESQLYRQLAVADVVVFLHSRASASSPWCQREIGIARFRHQSVLVVPIEDCSSSTLLSTVQQLRYRPGREQRHAEVVHALDQSGYGPETSYRWDVHASPYPGLAPFEADRAAVFFGREQDIRELEGYLNPDRATSAVILIAGASGTGKSSLIRAGLLPRLRRRPDWLVLDVLEPGPDFRERIAQVVAGLGSDNRDDAHPGRTRTVPILVVDQAERLLVGDENTGEGNPALEDLARALSDRCGLTVIIVTKTADTRLTAPIADWLVAKHLVVGLDRTQLAHVVAEPAARAGISVDPALVSRLVEATPSGEALPLLALTLAEMWNRRGSTTSLTLDDYERVGGVTKILTDVAQSVLRTLPTVPQDEVLSTLLSFVSVDHAEQAISVPQTLESFVGTPRRIVDAFADRRLLTIKDVKGRTGTRTVALTHDALMSSWREFAEAIKGEREQLVLENDVRREANRGEKDWTLLTGPRLDAALERFHDRESDGPVASYLAACRKARADAVAAQERATRLTIQRRRRTVLAATGMCVALVALTGVALLQRQNTEIQRQNTQITALEKAARAVSLSDTHRDQAVTAALEAIDLSPTPATYAALLQVLTDQPGPRHYLAAPGSGVRDIAWTPTSGLLVGSDAGVERMDEETGEREVLVPNFGQGVAVAASKDGSIVAALNTTQLALIDNKAVHQTQLGPPSLMPTLAMDSQGSRIAVADLTPAIRLLDRRGREVHKWPQDNNVLDMAMSADGHTLAVTDGAGVLSTLDMDSGVKTRFESVNAQLDSTAISPDGGTIVALSVSGQVERWTATRPKVSTELSTPGAASAVAFVANDVLAVGQEDGNITLLDPTTGNQLASFGSHRSPVMSIAGSSSQLFSVDKDLEVIAWDGIDAIPMLGEVVAAGVDEADVGEDGRLVALNTTDQTVREWPVSGQPRTGLGNVVLQGPIAAGPAGQLAILTNGSVHALDSRLRTAWKVSVSGAAALDWVGERLAVGTNSGGILLVRQGIVEDRVTVSAEKAQVTAVRGLPDGTVAWGTSQGDVGTWAAGGTKNVRHLGQHDSGRVTSLAYGASDQTLYSGGEDRQTLVWHLQDSASIQGRQAKPAPHQDDVVGMAQLSNAGQMWLASASQDSTIRLWDLRQDTEIGPKIPAPGRARYNWAASARSNRLATRDDKRRLIIWDLSPVGLLRTACRTLLPARSSSSSPPICDSNKAHP